jgi:hypothetical protein
MLELGSIIGSSSIFRYQMLLTISVQGTSAVVRPVANVSSLGGPAVNRRNLAGRRRFWPMGDTASAAPTQQTPSLSVYDRRPGAAHRRLSGSRGGVLAPALRAQVTSSIGPLVSHNGDARRSRTLS